MTGKLTLTVTSSRSHSVSAVLLPYMVLDWLILCAVLQCTCRSDLIVVINTRYLHAWPTYICCLFYPRPCKLSWTCLPNMTLNRHSATGNWGGWRDHFLLPSQSKGQTSSMEYGSIFQQLELAAIRKNNTSLTPTILWTAHNRDKISHREWPHCSEWCIITWQRTLQVCQELYTFQILIMPSPVGVTELQRCGSVEFRICCKKGGRDNAASAYVLHPL